ncbi:MAG: glycosyltransferase [Chloroflexi bacterium]|nr:glycosyltransferase [Chloroflexota bacterium]
MNVSVIIPAYNAAGTIVDTLESLRTQTFTTWEAIVVDDGSVDKTLTIAKHFAQCDHRICVMSQPHAGHSAARNTALHHARFDWLVFLDADDWILPIHLACLTQTLAANSDLDAVHCGWTQVQSDGMPGSPKYCSQSGDLFDLFARYCAFAMNACLVRRALVQAAGGFDVQMQTCGDWDMWQRVARLGARFGAIHQVLARHRMRPNSVSVNSIQLLRDALTVITHGHSSDTRVSNAHPCHANGMPTEQLAHAKLLFATWVAGLEIGRGKDARPCLALLKDDHAPMLEPASVAASIFQAALLPRCKIESDWVTLLPKWQLQIDLFLDALELQSQANGLAQRSRYTLEQLIKMK